MTFVFIITTNITWITFPIDRSHTIAIFYTFRMIDNLDHRRITVDLLHCRRIDLRYAILILVITSQHILSYNETEEMTTHCIAFFIIIDSAGEITMTLFACLTAIFGTHKACKFFCFKVINSAKKFWCFKLSCVAVHLCCKQRQH